MQFDMMTQPTVALYNAARNAAIVPAESVWQVWFIRSTGVALAGCGCHRGR